MKEKKFFSERTGMDTLNTFIAFSSGIFILVTWLTNRLFWIVPAVLLTSIFIWRGLSKNRVEREAANNEFRNIGPSIKKEWKLQVKKWHDRKKYVYKKCPRCRAVLRLKRRKGERQVVCPHCGTEFRLRIHFDGDGEKEE